MKYLSLLIVLLTAASCINGAEERIDVIPYPEHVALKGGEFNAEGASFYIDETIEAPAENAIRLFAENLSNASGTECSVKTGTSRKGFIFVRDGSMQPESYSLDISRKAVIAKASDLNGFIYAIQTLKQMLPVEIFGQEAAPRQDWTIRCASINDSPRFGYRGLHLDVSRHFFDVDVVKRYLDLMEIHKLNTFHWHLTDDQGWRIEIKKHPSLTTVGSVRKGTVIKKNWDQTDGIPYGGFYTQDQIREVVEYAASKGITVIPEIDFPGHMLAALTAYPELGCTGGPYDLWCRWGVAEDVLCVGKEETFKFIEEVLEEVISLFPSEYIHIGGDECPKVRWEECPHCQAKIRELGYKDDDKHLAEHYLQSYAISRVEKFLNGHGRKIIGWDEILEGGLAPNATVMSWRGNEGGREAARLGHDAIMVPTSYFYFDYYQSLDTDNEPFGIGGYVPVDKVYSYEPFDESMSEEERGHILGIQANLWTEYVKTEDHLHYMLLPRLDALSEVQWCRPENKSWERFTRAIPHMCRIYDVLGCNYAKHIFDLTHKTTGQPGKRSLTATLTSIDDAPIRYTLDGSDPTMDSEPYTGPVEITESCIFKAKIFREDMQTKILSHEYRIHKALGCPATLHTEPHQRYVYGAPASFTDGIRGTKSYTDGDWVGFFRTPMVVTISMDGKTPYSSVTASALIEKESHILSPTGMKVEISEDGENFTLVSEAAYPQETAADPNGLKCYTVTFPETTAPFIKVTVGCENTLYDWLGGAPYGGFIFIDEILVD